MVIRDTKGQQIYGQNTYFADTPTDDLEVGSEIKGYFSAISKLRLWGLPHFTGFDEV